MGFSGRTMRNATKLSGSIFLVLLSSISIIMPIKAAYQFPIQQYPISSQRQLGNFHSLARGGDSPSGFQYAHVTHHLVNNNDNNAQESEQRIQGAQRRSENLPDNSHDNYRALNEETQQLRHLHQVVDTMAELLNQEERQQHQGPRADMNRQVELQEPKMHELLSESDIRYALEELERIQHQERQAAANLAPSESRQQPTIVVSPSSHQTTRAEHSELLERQEQQQQQREMPAPAALQAANDRQALESLIDEFGDDLMLDDQLVSASQEAQRLVGTGAKTNARASPTEKEIFKESQQRSQASTQPPPNISTVVPPATLPPNPPSSSVAPATMPPTMAPKSAEGAPGNNTQSPLMTGQLESQETEMELNTALSNDFYSFHGDATANSVGGDIKRQNEQHQESLRAGLSQQQDLEQAAQQPRHSIAPQDPSTGQILRQFPPDQFQSLNQNQNQNSQQSPEQLVRVFRQQTNSIDEQAFRPIGSPQASSIQLPGVSPDNFWRPTITGSQLEESFNRPGRQGPVLPAPKFQSLAPSQPSFAQQQSQQQPQLVSANQLGNIQQIVGNNLNVRQQHTHFTGHSFLPQVNSRSPATLVGPTSAPMISVLSGSDSSLGGQSGNSVTWNPPASLNIPPAVQSQSQQQQPVPNTLINNNQQFFNPSHAPGEQFIFPTSTPASPAILNQNLQQQNAPRDSRNQAPQELNQFRFNTINNQFEAATESSRPQQPEADARFKALPANQWNQPAAASQPVNPERDAADSQQRSSFKMLPNNQRFFSPNDLINPRDQLANLQPTELPATTTRTSRQQQTTLTATTTPTTTTMASTTTPASTTTQVAPANSTAKKEDTVIYYYYYYDDSKNATVVAKNISSRAGPSNSSTPVPLEAAIEADSGVEDTPYMDDPVSGPAVGSNVRLPSANQDQMSSFRPQTSTVASLPSTSGGNRFASETTRSSGFFRGDPPPGNLNGRPNSVNQRQPAAEVGNPAPTITTTAASNSFFRPQANLLRNHQVNSFAPSSIGTTTTQSSSPPTTTSTTTSTTTTTAASQRLPTSSSAPRGGGQASRQGPVLAPARIQDDLIKNVLNGVGPQSGNSQARRQESFGQPANNVNRAQAASATAASASNLSRYGTNSNNGNNNLLIDPFQMNPAAGDFNPAVGGPTPRDEPMRQQHHHGHQHSAQRNKLTEAQLPVQNGNRIVSQPQQVPANLQQQQHFSSQRNTSNNQQPQQQPAASIRSPTPATQPKAQPAPAAPTRQFFPEQDQAREAPQPVSRVNQARQPSVASTSITPLDLDEAQPEGEFQRERIPPAGNGRPTTPDGNTGNGFTKSPPPMQVLGADSTPAPFASNRGTSTANQPATSMSRSFVAPQQNQVTTSVSLPASGQPSASASTGSSSTSSASSLTTAVADSSSSTSSSSPSFSTNQPSTSASPEASASTEPSSETSQAASTRKRFGNRNNRFQTRLNSLGSSGSRSTTSTTTTAAPMLSSTTRRPLSSTTRKSSKQLFPGRRGRLGGSSTSTTLAPASVEQAGEQVGNSSAATALNQIQVSTSTAFSITESSSSSVVTPSVAPSAAGRPRFGNSFTARGRTTSSTTTTSGESQPQSSTQRPSNLFGAQARTSTSRPRLSFLKQSTSRPTGSSTTSGASTAIPETTANSVGAGNLGAQPTSPSAERTVSSGPLSGSISDSSLIEDSMSEMDSGNTDPTETETRKEIGANQVVAVTTTTTTTTAAPQPATTGAPAAGETSGRNKPKVRPLFASRQRNTALFGNRRNNGNSTSS